ncbi:MAG: DUF4340 domain-containing protein [Rhodospirillales bacterium]
MSPKNFLILLIMTIAGVAAAAVAVMTRPGDDVYANLGDPIVPGLIDTVNEVATVRIESAEGGVLTFQRQADQSQSGEDKAGWGIVERAMYPVKANLVNAMVLKVAELSYLAPKTANPDLYPRLQLGSTTEEGSHAVSLRLAAKDGRPLADMIVGLSRSTLEGSSQGGTYFRLPGDDQTWLAKGALEIGKLISEWIETDIFDIKTQRIRRVQIDHHDGEKVVIFKDQEKDLDFILEGIPDGKKVKSPFSVNGVASSIDEYKIMDVARRDAHPIDPAKATRAVYETFDGMTVTALIQVPDQDATGDDAQYWVALDITGAEGSDEADGLRARTQPWVFRISDFRYTSIAKRMDDLVEDAGGS